jgi:hypothetical protein
MKVTKSKPVKTSKMTKAERGPRSGDKFAPKPIPKPSKTLKAKPRILGTGTFQLKKHSPRVV